MVSGYYRRRRRRMRAGTVAILIFLLAVLLVSCVAGSNAMWLPSLFGADVRIYQAEPIVVELPTDGARAKELTNAVEILVSSSAELTEFRSSKDAIRIYRNEILNALARSNYSAYVGNPTLSASLRQNYPHLNAALAIPAEDFENAASRYFGAGAVTNKDSECFSYLGKSACYVTPAQAKSLTVTLTPESLVETERTFRFAFALTDSDGHSVPYNALFVKRSDGSAYLKALEKV